MWSSAIIRLLRRRIVLGLILTLSLIYCVFSYLDKADFLDGDDVVAVKRTQPFIWRTLREYENSSSGALDCRNSVQGKVLIVDDRGFICRRHDILTNGCCSDSPPTYPQYSCETCNRNNCCAIYEYCISCCLHPDKKNILEEILTKASEENNVLFASVVDHFELCLAKCRTNSQSVQHENSYKDPKAKHCFGDLSPGNNDIQ